MSSIDFDIAATKPTQNNKDNAHSLANPSAVSPPAESIERAKIQIKNSDNFPGRSYIPIGIAAALSIVWVLSSLYYLGIYQNFSLSTLAISDVLLTVTALTGPVGLLWLIALVFQRSDPGIERRLGLSQNFHKLLSPVEVAEKRLVSISETLLEDIKKIEAVTILAEERIANLENRLEEKSSSLFRVAADAEARSATINESLGREREKIEDLTNNLNETFKSMQDISQKLLAESSDKIFQAQEASAATLAQFNKQSDQIKETAQSAEAQLTVNIKSLAEEIEKANNTSEVTETQVSKLLSKMADHIKATNEAMTDIETRADGATSALERHNLALSDTNETLEDTNETLGTAIEQNKKALKKISSYQTITEKKLVSLKNAGLSTWHKMSEIIEQFSDKLDHFTALSDKTEDGLNQTTDNIESITDTSINHIQNLDQTLSDFKDTFIAQEKAFQASAQTFNGHIDDGSKHISGKLEDLNQTIQDAKINMASEEAEIAGLYETIASNALSITSEMTRLINEIRHLSSQVADENDRAKMDNEQLAAELLKISTTSVNTLKQHNKDSAAALQELALTGQDIRSTAQSSADALRETTSESFETLTHTVDTLNTALNQQLEALKSEIDQKVSLIENDTKSTIHSVKSDAIGLAENIAAEGEKIALNTEKYLNRFETAQSDLVLNSKNDFAHLSRLIIESLQSNAIDIHKSLSHELPDQVWDAFNSGDRSVFMRKTVRMGTKNIKKAIADRFRSDLEFKENVSRYMRDFESLMERAMLGDRQNALAVTLISSEMGKLYVLLGQALKKFS